MPIETQLPHRPSSSAAGANGDRSLQTTSGRSTAWQALVAAMSPAMNQVIEGLAAYGEAMYLLAPSEQAYTRHHDRSALTDQRPLVRGRPAALPPPPAAGFARPETTTSAPWSSRIAVRLAGLRSALWRGWQQRRAIEALEALDDRTLRDIGLSRPQIAHAIRHGNLHR
jgi:uncharacterized protein YjiS (DUF1127 family)